MFSVHEGEMSTMLVEISDNITCVCITNNLQRLFHYIFAYVNGLLNVKDLYIWYTVVF